MDTANSTKIYAASADKWNDLEKLFGLRGACAGCWCMYWRLTNKEFKAGQGDENRFRLWKLIMNGDKPGLIIYVAGRAAGWLALAPRTQYARLAYSRILAPVDDENVWSTPCFYIDKNFRGLGLTKMLLEAAIIFTKNNGGRILEGYPIDTGNVHAPSVFMYTGALSAFVKSGFVEVARRSKNRPVMRYMIK